MSLLFLASALHFLGWSRAEEAAGDNSAQSFTSRVLFKRVRELLEVTRWINVLLAGRVRHLALIEELLLLALKCSGRLGLNN